MNCLMIILFIILICIIILASFTPRKEKFELDNGICDCSFIKCKDYEKQRDKCCNGGFSFDRYTFS